MGVEFQPADMTERSKKKAIKALKVIPENGSIDHQAEEDFSLECERTQLLGKARLGPYAVRLFTSTVDQVFT
jgi:hypothetical protein